MEVNELNEFLELDKIITEQESGSSKKEVKSESETTLDLILELLTV